METSLCGKYGNMKVYKKLGMRMVYEYNIQLGNVIGEPAAYGRDNIGLPSKLASTPLEQQSPLRYASEDSNNNIDRSAWQDATQAA